jgi:hypothetical protein
VPDLSNSSIGVALGYNNTAFVSGLCHYLTDDDYVWRIIYASSTDMGNTWTPISVIPGTEALNFSNGYMNRQFSAPVLDGAGNWHIFGVGRDTTEYTVGEYAGAGPFRGYDFRYDGSTWTIIKFAFPQLLECEIAAMGVYNYDYVSNFIHPSVGPDGTFSCAYADVKDTTGSMGAVEFFNWNIMVMFSEDNGTTWQGPVSVLDQWEGLRPVGMANKATDKIHIVYRRHFFTAQADLFFYMGVPTDTIKARATRVEQKITKIMPIKFALHQNFPNPFNPTTTITFDLKDRTHVTLKIFNELGQEVATLLIKPWM